MNTTPNAPIFKPEIKQQLIVELQTFEQLWPPSRLRELSSYIRECSNCEKKTDLEIEIALNQAANIQERISRIFQDNLSTQVDVVNLFEALAKYIPTTKLKLLEDWFKRKPIAFKGYNFLPYTYKTLQAWRFGAPRAKNVEPPLSAIQDLAKAQTILNRVGKLKASLYKS